MGIRVIKLNKDGYGEGVEIYGNVQMETLLNVSTHVVTSQELQITMKLNKEYGGKRKLNTKITCENIEVNLNNSNERKSMMENSDIVYFIHPYEKIRVLFVANFRNGGIKLYGTKKEIEPLIKEYLNKELGKEDMNKVRKYQLSTSDFIKTGEFKTI